MILHYVSFVPDPIFSLKFIAFHLLILDFATSFLAQPFRPRQPEDLHHQGSMKISQHGSYGGFNDATPKALLDASSRSTSQHTACFGSKRSIHTCTRSPSSSLA